MLAADVVWTADSGGKASASRRPVVGAERVARVLVGLFRLAAKMPDIMVKTVICNSAPALVVYFAAAAPPTDDDERLVGRLVGRLGVVVLAVSAAGADESCG